MPRLRLARGLGRHFPGALVHWERGGSQAEAVKARFVVNGKYPAASNRQTGEVHPTLHRISALIEQLAAGCVQRHQNGGVGSGRTLGAGQQIALPFLRAPEVRHTEHMVLPRVFAGRQGIQNAVGNYRGIGQIHIGRDPGGFEPWRGGLRRADFEGQNASVWRVPIGDGKPGGRWLPSLPKREVEPRLAIRAGPRRGGAP